MRFNKIAVGAFATAASAAPQDPSILIVGTASTVIAGTATTVVAARDATATTPSAAFVAQALKYENTDGAQVISKLNVVDDGFTHIGDDGIARSWAGNGTVIDAIPLTNTQLLTMISEVPLQLKPYVPHLREVYANTSGFNVPQDQWFNPPTSIKPAEFGGPQRKDAALDAEANEIAKKHGAGPVEEISVNPAFLVTKDLQKRNPPVCLGMTCVRASSCIFAGCLTCQDFDLILLSQRICMGVRADTPPTA